jgi:acetyl-CoA acetyltransferase
VDYQVEPHGTVYAWSRTWYAFDRVIERKAQVPYVVVLAEIPHVGNSLQAIVAAIIDHGFCTRETAGSFITFENLIAPAGKFPVNTAGGNLADGFLHGMSLLPETVRQIRGTSPNQVPDAQLSLMTGGPGDTVVSSALLGSEATL